LNEVCIPPPSRVAASPCTARRSASSCRRRASRASPATWATLRPGRSPCSTGWFNKSNSDVGEGRRSGQLVRVHAGCPCAPVHRPQVHSLAAASLHNGCHPSFRLRVAMSYAAPADSPTLHRRTGRGIDRHRRHAPYRHRRAVRRLVQRRRRSAVPRRPGCRRC
jgi:hypothetical protein